jgi:hypothetical protein
MDDNIDLKTALQNLFAERDRIDRDIEALKRIMGLEEVQADSGHATNRDPNLSFGGTTKALHIRADEFFSMSQTDAAAAYLKKVGHAVHIDQILEALKAGGVKFSGKEPKINLYTVLVRGTRRFVLVSPSTFGLVDFYPNRKSGKDKE